MGAQGDLIKLKVHAGAREDRLSLRTGGGYEVWVRAPAEGGRANAAVLSLVAAELGCPAKSLLIVKGATSPSKIVRRLGV